MGAQFTKDCGGGTCKYRGELWSPNQQVRYYVESVDGERVFCVKNYRTGLGACATSLISFRLEELAKHLTSGRGKFYWVHPANSSGSSASTRTPASARSTCCNALGNTAG